MLAEISPLSGSKNGGQVRLLNIGCGVTTAPGCVNVDHTEHVFIARVPGLAVSYNQ